MRRKPKAAEQINAEQFGGLILQMWLLSTYGPRLDMRELAAVLRMGLSTIVRDLANGKFPVRTHVDEAGHRFADFRDVAFYIEQCRHAVEEETV